MKCFCHFTVFPRLDDFSLVFRSVLDAPFDNSSSNFSSSFSRRLSLHGLCYIIFTTIGGGVKRLERQPVKLKVLIVSSDLKSHLRRGSSNLFAGASLTAFTSHNRRGLKEICFREEFKLGFTPDNWRRRRGLKLESSNISVNRLVSIRV